jgi:dethiobiotin synthetase
VGKGIFVTGTDTGVGKTLVTGGIAALLRESGIDVGVMKPAESGCRRENGILIPEDAIFLKEMSGCQDDLKLINPYALEHPLAPGLAAEVEGVDIRLEVIREAYFTLMSRHEVVLVEGAGGMLVPLTSNLLVIDLVKKLGGIPVLVVTRAHLGTINHTLLTLYYIRREGMEVLGVVMNRTCPENGLAESLNSQALQQWGQSPLMGDVHFLPSTDKENIKKSLESKLNLNILMTWLKRGKDIV